MMHPYRSQPARAFWTKTVASGWDPQLIIPQETKLLNDSDRIASLGSCFAANLVPYLRARGYDYIEKESRHPLFSGIQSDNFSYDKFSASYGNIYTARQFRQLLERALHLFRPVEDRWYNAGEVIDPFRPGLRYRARSDSEFDLLSSQHLAKVREVFEEATVVIFTLGLTEAWLSRADGAVFPACPGTVAGEFDPEKHAFHNFVVAEIVDDLRRIRELLLSLHRGTRLIVTVSPVPLIATATDNHVLVASTYSKSVLRAACGEICCMHDDVIYFPSYEIVTGPQASDDFYEPDRRNVTKKGIDTVMRAFLGDTGAETTVEVPLTTETGMTLSKLLSQVECEEAASAKC